eukprot:m.197033 g.197033  ORF g.197033 m.197033 type:complete len:301 (-) comp17657_c0_seq1:3252-4154(-)
MLQRLARTMSVPASLLTGRQNIVIPRPDELKKKILEAKAATASDLEVIADFDMTITQYWVDGKRGTSCHGVLNYGPTMTKEYREESDRLTAKYYPMEISDLPLDQKIEAMIEWWTKSHDLMVEHKLRKEHLAEMVKTPSFKLRDGAADLMRKAHEHNVPFFIFSAGLYDVIHAFLDDRQLAKYHAHVVSNMMDFDETGLLRGFKGALIHSFNKNSAAIKQSPGWVLADSRHTAILLGDSLGDVNMTQGLDEHTIIKIGFLNIRIEEQMSRYMDVYDVVLLNDAPMDYPNELLDFLCQADA